MSSYGATMVCTDEPEYDFMKLERQVSKNVLLKLKVVILFQNEKPNSKKSRKWALTGN